MELGPKASRFCSLLPPGGFFKYCLRGFLTCPSKERELKSVLMKVREWKNWLKTKHSKD